MSAYLSLNDAKGRRGRWPWEQSTDHGVHFRPDDSVPVTACGLDFAGRFATAHPVTTGDAFDCADCRQSWLDTVTLAYGTPMR